MQDMAPTTLPVPARATAPSTQAPVPAPAPTAAPTPTSSAAPSSAPASAPVSASAPTPAQASSPVPVPAAAQPSLQQDRQETNGEIKDMLQMLLRQVGQMMPMTQQQMAQQSQFQERSFALLLDQQQHQPVVGLGNGQQLSPSAFTLKMLMCVAFRRSELVLIMQNS
nr:protein MLP1 homolog [Penaeus vannamei]